MAYTLRRTELRNNRRPRYLVWRSTAVIADAAWRPRRRQVSQKNAEYKTQKWHRAGAGVHTVAPRPSRPAAYTQSVPWL